MSLAQEQNHRGERKNKKGGGRHRDGLLIAESRLHTAAHLSISKFGRRERAPPVRPLILELLSPALGVHHRVYPLALSFLPTYSVSQWLDACFVCIAQVQAIKYIQLCGAACRYALTRSHVL